MWESVYPAWVTAGAKVLRLAFVSSDQGSKGSIVVKGMSKREMIGML